MGVIATATWSDTFSQGFEVPIEREFFLYQLLTDEIWLLSLQFQFPKGVCFLPEEMADGSTYMVSSGKVGIPPLLTFPEMPSQGIMPLGLCCSFAANSHQIWPKKQWGFIKGSMGAQTNTGDNSIMRKKIFLEVL